MVARAVLFAITPEQRATLLEAPDDEARRAVIAEIEEAWDSPNLQELDKSWDAIHRALAREDKETDEFPPGGDDRPLARAILGGKAVMEDEENYVIRLVEPEHLAAIAEALAPIDEDAFRALYDAHCRGVELEYDDDGLEYSWDWFQGVQDFYRQVAGSGRTVIFTVDL